MIDGRRHGFTATDVARLTPVPTYHAVETKHHPRRAAWLPRLVVEIALILQQFSRGVRCSYTMTRKLPLIRPATSAIAAFLVLSSTNAFAQETATPVAAPTVVPTLPTPTVAPPTATAPVASPAPDPVIRVPVDIEPAPAPVAKATPRPAPKAADRAAPAPRTAPAEPATAAPAATVAADTSAVLPPDAAATALPDETMVAVPATADPVPTPAVAPAVNSNGFPWELAGGAAALLIVGGAAIAFTRRRRSREDRSEPMIEAASRPVTPVSPAPALARETVAAPSPAIPASRSTPAFAAAPSGSMGRHEAMALVGPTVDNPFLTLKKRLKRARFYDRRERMAYDGLLDQPQVARQPVSAWEIANRPEPVPVAKQQAARRPDQAPVFPGRLRPGFAGS